MALLAIGSAPPASNAATKTTRPNILILFTDDQRADAVGALGNRQVRTPNLDALVRRSLVFRNAYCLGGDQPAVCTPSRNMLLSGRSFFRYNRAASPTEPNLPAAFNAAGYTTYHHGKRGNSAVAIQALFKTNRYLEEEKDRVSGEPGKAIADGAIEFLRTNTGAKPFLMYLAFEAPHDPRVASDEYLNQYDAAQLRLPRNFLPIHPFDNGEMTIRDELLAPWPRTPDEIRRHLREYYAVITGLDRHIGRVLTALKESGQEESTIIVFASDQGLALGSHGLMGKQNLYEDGMRVPFTLAGPGIRPGRSDALVYLLDLFPTLTNLSGLSTPIGVDGKGLKPVIERKRKGVRDLLFTAYRHVQRSVRDDRWKLIRYPEIDRTQLFDLKNDPDERKDLATDPRYRSRLERLTLALQATQRDYGDTLAWTATTVKSQVFTPPAGEELERMRRQGGRVSPERVQ